MVSAMIVIDASDSIGAPTLMGEQLDVAPIHININTYLKIIGVLPVFDVILTYCTYPLIAFTSIYQFSLSLASIITIVTTQMAMELYCSSQDPEIRHDTIAI